MCMISHMNIQSWLQLEAYMYLLCFFISVHDFSK